MMIETAIVLLSILVVSLIIQERIKIPMPITTITIVAGMAINGYHPIDINDHSFDDILTMILPLLILADVVHLKPKLVRKHWKSIFATAGVAVVLSIIAGVLLREYILPEYHIAIPVMIMLMTTVIATDPVTTGAIFGNYDLPEDLKFLVESESLFNDATSVIAFTLALWAYQHPDVTSMALVQMGADKVIFSVVVGMVIGLLCVVALELVVETMAEAAILILSAMLSFFVAEHVFHASGIFAVVVGALTVTSAIYLKCKHSEEALHNFENDEMGHKLTRSLLSKLENLAITANNKESIFGYISFLALFANTVLFVSMASLINFELIFFYWKEVLSVFIASFMIRGGVMWAFMKFSNIIPNMRSISFDWWLVMTGAGIKGGISILLLHLMGDVPNKELFEAIVVGNIILSTFVFSVVLTLIIKFRGKQINECSYK